MAGIAFLILFPFFLCTCIGIKKWEKRWPWMESRGYEISFGCDRIGAGSGFSPVC